MLISNIERAYKLKAKIIIDDITDSQYEIKTDFLPNIKINIPSIIGDQIIKPKIMMLVR